MFSETRYALNGDLRVAYSPRTRPGRPSAILSRAIPTPRLDMPTTRPILE